jgi:enoyl-CoA hydratase/carnithine racemase
VTILQEVRDGVMTLSIARPERRNALTVAMYAALAAALVDADANPKVRAVVLTGAGGIFTAGNDLEDFMNSPPQAGSGALNAPVFDFMRALLGCSKPVIAAVIGPAVGIGATLLLHCDLVYVSDDARISMPFINLGLVPEFASSRLLPQRIGQAKAAAMLLLGDPMLAPEAVACGMANAALPATEVLPAALRAALRLAALPPGAVRESRRLLRGAEAADIVAVIAAEAKVFGERLRSPEAREAMQAFFEKRKPDFSRF